MNTFRNGHVQLQIHNIFNIQRCIIVTFYKTQKEILNSIVNTVNLTRVCVCVLQVMGLPPGVNGACLHTNLSKSQRDKVVEALVAGAYHFLLISPETLVGSGANSTLPGIDRMPPIAFACIDEVHCVSEWSHHFRPSYLRLCKVSSVMTLLPSSV